MHDPLVLALMVALLALQISFKLLDSRAKKKNGNGAGMMSKEAWILILRGLIQENMQPLQDKHQRLADKLIEMTKEVHTNRQIITDKIDKIFEYMITRK